MPRAKRDPKKQREASARYVARHPNKVRDNLRRYRYGTDGTELWTGKCHACDSALEQYDRHTHLDHCHTTGKVRGWLCRTCNNGIGMLNDNPQRLELAAAYLRRYA